MLGTHVDHHSNAMRSLRGEPERRRGGGVRVVGSTAEESSRPRTDGLERCLAGYSPVAKAWMWLAWRESDRRFTKAFGENPNSISSSIDKAADDGLHRMDRPPDVRRQLGARIGRNRRWQKLVRRGRQALALDDMRTIADRDPDIIAIMPCGFDIARTLPEMSALTERAGWSRLSAVRNKRVYLTDGNQYFNRPGPRSSNPRRFSPSCCTPISFPSVTKARVGFACLARCEMIQAKSLSQRRRDAENLQLPSTQFGWPALRLGDFA